MKRRTQAFTLIEMLVATGIFCIMVVLLSQILSPTMEAVGHGRRFFELHSKARGALDLIARDVSRGIYRSDLAAFKDTSNQPALAFFTQRAGKIGTNDSPDSYRYLSYVLYQATQGADSNFSLWRGAINLRWDTNTYPVISGLSAPLPFSTNAVADAYPEAGNTNSGTLEAVLNGVARLEVRFLGTDGLYRKAYSSVATNGIPVSKAVTVTLLVTDERTQDLIVRNPSFLATFQQNFLSTNGRLASMDDVSDRSLRVQWESALNQSDIWNGLPKRARDSIYTFERTIPLR